MSSEVTTVAYRFPIPALKGVSDAEALKFFRRIIGEPEGVDELGDETYFWYKSLPYLKENPTEFREFLRPVQVGDEWGLQVIIGIVNLEHYNYIGFQADVLHGKGINLPPILDGLAEVGISEDLIATGKVYAYTYYNGVDEPLTFE